MLLVNTSGSPESIEVPEGVQLITADVTGAAEAAGVIVGGQPIVSAAILGSVAKATGVVDMDAVEFAIREAFAPAAAEKNVEAARLAFACTPAGTSA
jgi:pyruvate ferredoxin oxidoreductase gamma subunit/2-oxoisovalerate ferredoxin oxidoreductase gamma subunit